MTERVHKSRRWLCIAYAFPPINRSGTHRTLGFVRELEQLGWTATVLTVATDQDATDPDLLRDVPPNTNVIRTRWNNYRGGICSILRRHPAGGVDTARPRPVTPNPTEPRPAGSLRRLVTGLLALPDSRVGWLLPAVYTAIRAAKRTPFDVVYSTSPYPTAHLIALLVSRVLKRPWVADFRDPWRGNPFDVPKHPWVDRLDAYLERLVIRNADQIVTTSPTLTDRMRRRFPDRAAKFSTILNAFDDIRITRVRPHRPIGDDCFIITHAGQFYGSRSPVPIFLALRHLRSEDPRLAARVRLILIGPPTYHDRYLYDIAAEHGVADLTVVPGRKPHGDTLNWIAGSNAVMLAAAVGDGAELQIPNKLFEYMALKRPILALSSPRNPLAVILQEAGAVAEFADPQNVLMVAESIRRLMIAGESVGPAAWSGVARFERSRRARQLAGIFDRLAGTDGRLPVLLHTVACQRSWLAPPPANGYFVAPDDRTRPATIPAE